MTNTMIDQDVNEIISSLSSHFSIDSTKESRISMGIEVGKLFYALHKKSNFIMHDWYPVVPLSNRVLIIYLRLTQGMYTHWANDKHRDSKGNLVNV